MENHTSAFNMSGNFVGGFQKAVQIFTTNNEADEVVLKIERILLNDRRITIRKLDVEVPECSEVSIDSILRGKLGYY